MSSAQANPRLARDAVDAMPSYVVPHPVTVLGPLPAGSRAARAVVKWKQEDLAEAAALGVSTVQDYEREGRKPQARSFTAINEAFAQVGITFFNADETRLIGHLPESKTDDSVQGMCCVQALPQPTSRRAARELLKWMQIHLAERAQVGVSTVQDYERGERNPHPRSLATIQQAFFSGRCRVPHRRWRAGP